MAQKCECFVENCDTCRANGQCSKCLAGFFLFDNDDDSIHDSCIKCDIITGCVDQSIVIENSNLDGTGY